MTNQQFEISFNDNTLIEGDGVYDKIKGIMDGEFVGDTEWMLRTNCTLITLAGVSEMVLHFYFDKSVYIVEYIPSIRDVFYNPDISVLSQWLQLNGWDIPSPSRDLVNSDKGLWKHFWDTYLINSDYLDSLYGKRDDIYNDDQTDKE